MSTLRSNSASAPIAQPGGQLWFTTEGGDADTRIVRVNSDGSDQTVVVSNGVSGLGDDQLASSFTSDIGLDTAAGFYFALLSDSLNEHALLVRGQIGSTANPTVVVDFPDAAIVNSIEVDAFNGRIYVGMQDGSGLPDGSITGIRVYSYNSVGVLTDLGFLTTAISDNRGNESGYYVLDPQDFALDSSIGRLFYSERVDGLVTGLFRLDLADPNFHTQLVAQAQFPDNQSNGVIMDVEVDASTDLVYFVTQSLGPAGTADYNAAQNALWYISENASNGMATQVTLVGLPGGHAFYPGDMTFDRVNRQLYIESEETDGSQTDDVIYVFQLDGSGTTATLINSISPNPPLLSSGANIEGMVFSSLPVLSNLNGTASPVVEQAAGVTTLLNNLPLITDAETSHLAGATIQVTGGTFSSNESSSTSDHLGYGPSKQVSGTIPGTNITVSWDAANERLTLTGFDTISNYQAVLQGIVFWSTGDNPTNYGLNTTRTITWTVSDGMPGMPEGGVNSGTTQITINAVNDAPVNGAVSSASGSEDTQIDIVGLQISDPDANPAVGNVTVTLGVTKGVLTLLTNVANGLTSGEITGNGTSSISISGTLDHINATLSAVGGLKFLGDPDLNGTDTLTVTTNDGGSSGSGGNQSDTDLYTITLSSANDAPVVNGDGTETLAATNEDVSPTTLANTISSLFGSQFDDSRDTVSGGSSANSFAGVAVVANGSSGGTGQWQYWNGSTWVNIGAASASAAVELSAATAIRFAPAVDFNGAAPTLTVRLIDSSGGAITNGTIVNTTTNGGSTVFSTGTVVLDHAVTAVNDAPVVTGGSSVSLATVAEDSAPGAGETISSLFSSHFSDAKDGGAASAFAGVAVTNNAATAAAGTYQYFSGGVWTDLPAVSPGSAFVLEAATLVRFAPAPDYFGAAPVLTVSMIEDTSGAVTTGQTADLSVVGGATPYSAAMTLGITVTSSNDPATGGASISGAAAEDQVLTAVSTLADPDGMGTLHYDWQRDTGGGGGFVSTGAADQATYTLGDADIGAVIRVVISFTDGGGALESATSPATATITAANDAPTGGVAITGTVKEDQVLTADTSLLADSDGLGTLHYDWQRNTGSGFVSIGAADQANYTLDDADVGALIRVVVSYTDGQGFSDSVVSPGTAAVAAVNDPHTGGVSISGTATEGQVLTVNSTLADVDGLGTPHYDWQRDTGSGFVSIGAADQASYTLGDADVDALIRVVVSYTDGQGFTESATSAATAAVSNVNEAPTGAVTLSGAAAENQVLTAVTTTLTDGDGLGTLHYDWQRNTGSGFVSIGAADVASYTLGDADVGSLIRVVVSYTDGHGASEAVTSDVTAAVSAINDPHTGGVSINGAATEDQVLTVISTLADADGLGTLHYDWQRDTGSGFVSIGAADQATYTLGDADVGGTVQVVVSYTDGQGFTESATAAATGTVININDLPTGAVTIAGSAVEGQTLSVSNTLADADGLGPVSYQWKENGGDIVGATGSTFALTSAQLGKTITVVASYTDARGQAESVTSAATSAVGSQTPPPTTGTTVIDGTPVTVTQTTNADGSVTQTTTIPTVTGAASDQIADIPLVSQGGQPLLTVSAPVGFSLTVTGDAAPDTSAGALDGLIAAIRAVSGPNDQTPLTGGGSGFLGTLPTNAPVLVQTVTPTLAPGAAPTSHLTFNGGPSTGDGVYTALVIDARNLPSGTVIDIGDIDFVTVVGAVRLGGGTGAQTVFGDSAGQYIVLGPDDDVIHGGGGDDTVGSLAGNDKLYGDDGNDTLFGGAGDDMLDGGAGQDIAEMAGVRANYTFVHGSSGLVAFGFEGDDTLRSIETLKMSNGALITDLAGLVAGTTSVATMTYQFFTGKTPTGAGLDYLLHAPDTVNARDLGDAYYQNLNIENRYINFAINLASAQGQAHAWFQDKYGALTLSQTVTKAYAEIFGVTPTAEKVGHLLQDQVAPGLTRQGFFEAYAGSAEATKAAVIGWLLAAAIVEDTGRYATANKAFLADFNDGAASLNVDLVAVYGDGQPWGGLV